MVNYYPGMISPFVSSFSEDIITVFIRWTANFNNTYHFNTDRIWLKALDSSYDPRLHVTEITQIGC